MRLTSKDLAKMFDLSCVQMHNGRENIERLVSVARQYGFGHISTLQCFLPLARELIGQNSEIKLVGNISFPSGSDTTQVKLYQAEQMLPFCDEVDMVMNIGLLKSGDHCTVLEDVKAVRAALNGVTMKVIIESPILSEDEIRAACNICMEAGADFVKTGTGWGKPTTIEQVRLIKSIVGDHIAIKASGGVHTLELLREMYRAGVARFGVNMDTGIALIEECNVAGGVMEL